MSESQVSVSLPASSVVLSQGLQGLILAIIANHKAGGAAELTGDITAAVQTLLPAVGQLAGLPGEAIADPIGLAEAFAISGLELGRKLSKPSA